MNKVYNLSPKQIISKINVRQHFGKVRKFGPIALIMLSSQFFSALSLFLLPTLGLKTSDIYSVLIQLGQGPYNGLVLGVIYLLAIGRPGFKHWNISRAFLLLFAVGLSLQSFFLLKSDPKKYGLSIDEVEAFVLIFGAGAFGLGLAGIEGARKACMGRPIFLASSSLVPNLFLLSGTMVSLATSSEAHYRIFIPAASWAVGCITLNIANALFLKPVTSENFQEDDGGFLNKRDSGSGIFLHAAGLSLGLLTSIVLPIFFTYSTGNIKGGATTVLFIVSRLGNAGITLVVNSFLMVRYNWNTEVKKDTPISVFASTGAIILAVFAAIFHAFGWNSASYLMICGAWLSALIAAPLLLRVCNVLKLGAFVLAKSAIDVVVTTALTVYFSTHPSITGYFSLFMVSQGLTCTICGLGLKQYKASFVYFTLFITSVILVVTGW